MINDQLAGKDMTVGRYYLHSGDMLAAIGRFKTVIDKYQTTSHTPEALERLVEAYASRLASFRRPRRTPPFSATTTPGSYWYDVSYKLMESKGLVAGDRAQARPPRPVPHRQQLLPACAAPA